MTDGENMSILVSEEELKSITDFQKEIHSTSNASEKIISNFYREFIKSTWYSSTPVKMNSSIDNQEIVYTINSSFHYLNYSYMRFMLPPIKVKKEFKGQVRIAWCHNVGTNIVKKAVLKENDGGDYHKFDNVWLDIYFQFYQNGGAGKREAHNIGVGNVKCLEDWSEFLPAYPINVDQPWYYSMDGALAFPILFKGSLTRAEHRYTFRRKISDLLRVQVLKDGKWRDTTKKIHTYLDIRANAKIRIPELWGRYSYNSADELGWQKCESTHTFYTRDVEICDKKNPNIYKSVAEIDLHSTKPCLAFFWLAENIDASDNHNYSNYTNDSNDLYSGWDPIKTTTLTYGTIIKFENMPSDHFSIAEPRKHFPSAPCERGYHGYSNANDSTSFDADIGLVYAGMNAKLQCYIDNNNIFMNSYKGEEEDEEEGDEEEEKNDKKEEEEVSSPPEDISPNFITRVRLLVMRKFTVTESSDGSYKFLIK